MDKRFLEVFTLEVSRQATFGILAYEDLMAAISARNATRIWYSVQSLLVAAGNVSKLIWPPRKRSTGRGKELREAIGVTETSPLKARMFRNIFEHYDEQLEDWMMSSERHNIVDSSVIPLGAIQGVDPEDFLRNIDPNDWTLTFRGSRLEIRPLVEALREVRDKADAIVSTGRS